MGAEPMTDKENLGLPEPTLGSYQVVCEPGQGTDASTVADFWSDSEFSLGTPVLS